MLYPRGIKQVLYSRIYYTGIICKGTLLHLKNYFYNGDCKLLYNCACRRLDIYQGMKSACLPQQASPFRCAILFLFCLRAVPTPLVCRTLKAIKPRASAEVISVKVVSYLTVLAS